MSAFPFTRGIHDLGNSIYAYLQPDGGWGWSNAGLITDSGEALLVDTLFDVPLTAAMLSEMKRKVPAAAQIGRLVNSHSNGDHTFGNQLFGGAEIIASERCAHEMRNVPLLETMRHQKANLDQLGIAGRMFRHTLAPFDFDTVTMVYPTRTFSDTLTLHVGAKRVELIEVGPAHTAGDILVHVPDERVVFTADILFMEGHPVMWEGPLENWITALDRILAMDVEVVVPGHGPITDKDGVRALRGYFEYVDREARALHDAGVPPYEAARRIDMSDYDGWRDGERIAVNVATIYRKLDGDATPPDRLRSFTEMAKLRFGEDHVK